MLREARPITDAKRFIQQHYQEALRLEDVSNAVGFNATYFSAMFKKETGQNFMDYLTELRMNKAKELLCSDENSVQDVADQIGYRDLKYFSRLFKKTTGISPSDDYIACITSAHLLLTLSECLSYFPYKLHFFE